jgi:hypothetical protein
MSGDLENNGIMKKLREKIEEKIDKVTEIKGSLSESLGDLGVQAADKITDIKHLTTEYLGVTKEIGKIQAANWKSEGQFLKKIFQQKDIILVKTDAIAIVLRKVGGNEEFFEIVDNLTKERYRLVHHESIRANPSSIGPNYSLGTLYYFQNMKYISE